MALCAVFGCAQILLHKVAVEWTWYWWTWCYQKKNIVIFSCINQSIVPCSPHQRWHGTLDLIPWPKPFGVAKWACRVVWIYHAASLYFDQALLPRHRCIPWQRLLRQLARITEECALFFSFTPPLSRHLVPPGGAATQPSALWLPHLVASRWELCWSPTARVLAIFQKCNICFIKKQISL